ncbi:MAG: dihydrolipoyl dehydrogenase [Simkaniaceae bacterium]|nr:dihydrolipoyl dehydrogenase [Simkaniaceae bacterium]
MTRKAFDVTVIGAGPGGYVAAIKAAQSGKSVALIEKNFLGGSCLNCGCIPTKTLLANADVLGKIKRAEEYGISTGEVRFDYAKMKGRKDNVVSGIRQSLEGLLKANKIEIIMGEASFVSAKEIRIKDQSLILDTQKVIIATGSKPMDIAAFPCDHKRVLDSTSLLEIDYVPKSIAIVGGGYIGCEFASLFAELGSKVTIIEALPAIVQAQGKTISDFLSKSFQKRGIEIMTNTRLEKIETQENGVKMLTSNKEFEAEIALISIGRSVVSDGLNLGAAGIGTNERGMIEVNEQMETSVPGIFAIGDVTGKAMLAHVASHQGIVAAANATGGYAQMHYHAVPAVIFTHPEIAMVGLNLEEAKERGYNAVHAQFPFAHHGKAIAAIETDGFAQIVIDKETRQVLGAQVVGHSAADLIGEMAIAVQNELTVECVTDTIHAHPTMGEGWLEAALIASETPIHFPPKVGR